jgi:hypothetical protein
MAKTTDNTTTQSDKLKSYIAAYPHEKTFYIATDGQVFLSKNKKEADAHQKYIAGDKTVATVNVE